MFIGFFPIGTLSNRLLSVASPAPKKTAKIPTYGLVVDWG